MREARLLDYLFIGSSLGKDLSTEKHSLYGLCVGPKQPRDGENVVLLVPSHIAEATFPRACPCQSFLA